MKRRHGSQREARDLTQQDIEARCRGKTWCSVLKTLCDGQDDQRIAFRSNHIPKCVQKPKLCSCLLHHMAAWATRWHTGGGANMQLQVGSAPSMFVCVWPLCVCDLPLRPHLIRGCRFSWRGELFLAGWQWCHECFLILWAWVMFSSRDSTEFSCCSGRGGKGVEPTDEEGYGGGGVSVESFHSIQCPLKCCFLDDRCCLTLPDPGSCDGSAEWRAHTGLPRLCFTYRPNCTGRYPPPRQGKERSLWATPTVIYVRLRNTLN